MTDVKGLDALAELERRGRLTLPLQLYEVDGEEYAVLEDDTLGGVAPDFDLGPRSGERVPEGADVLIVDL